MFFDSPPLPKLKMKLTIVQPTINYFLTVAEADYRSDSYENRWPIIMYCFSH